MVMGNMFSLPLKDSSIDIVFTRTAIEPNGGHEREILQELYRITNEYLILIEPAYDLADDRAKKYMRKCGYVTKLYDTAKKLGYKIIMWELYGISVNPNPLNPLGIMIIEKRHGNEIENPLCCPITKGELVKLGTAYFSEKALLAYPVLNGVPCLMSEYAIVATKMKEFF